jgi:hypothetical protein
MVSSFAFIAVALLGWGQVLSALNTAQVKN